MRSLARITQFMDQLPFTPRRNARCIPVQHQSERLGFAQCEPVNQNTSHLECCRVSTRSAHRARDLLNVVPRSFDGGNQREPPSCARRCWTRFRLDNAARTISTSKKTNAQCEQMEFLSLSSEFGATAHWALRPRRTIAPATDLHSLIFLSQPTSS